MKATSAGSRPFTSQNLHITSQPSTGVTSISITGDATGSLLGSAGELLCASRDPAPNDLVFGCVILGGQAPTGPGLLGTFILNATGDGCINVSLVSSPGNAVLDTYTVDAAVRESQENYVDTSAVHVIIGEGSIDDCPGAPDPAPTRTFTPVATRDADPHIHGDTHEHGGPHRPRAPPSLVRRDRNLPGDTVVPNADRYRHANTHEDGSRDAHRCTDTHGSTDAHRCPNTHVSTHAHRRTDANRRANPHRRTDADRRANTHRGADADTDARRRALRRRDGRWPRELARYRRGVEGAAASQPGHALRRQSRRSRESTRLVPDLRPARPPLLTVAGRCEASCHPASA